MASILVVDDERCVPWLVALQLRAAGHEATCAFSGAEALRLFRADPARFDLLITDVVMPGMSGMELAKELLAIKPTLPVVVMSGFTSEVWTAPNPRARFAFLAKPFHSRQLVETANSLLRDTPEHRLYATSASGR